MWKHHNLHAEVAEHLPTGYFCGPIFTRPNSVGWDVDIYSSQLENGWRGRPIAQLHIEDVLLPDRLATAYLVRGRLFLGGLDYVGWQPFPDFKSAVVSLTTQHRLGVGNAR